MSEADTDKAQTPARPPRNRLILKTLKARRATARAIADFYEKVWVKGEGAVWFWGAVVGLIAGYAMLGFRILISAIQVGGFGASIERISDAAEFLPWHAVLAVPIAGGLVVSGLLYLGKRWNWLPETRAESIADVIEARAVRQGRIEGKTTAWSALVSAVSLGAGASAGREGPAVHLGAGLASMLTRALGLPARSARTLLACGAAAAVSASFNAPIAGVLFALEVILGHYALRVIAPVAIASIAASVIAAIHFGAEPAFLAPELTDLRLSYFPLAALLGFISAFTAMAFMQATLKTPVITARWAEKLSLPLWALPPFGGLAIGFIGLIWPEVLGIGYEATSAAIAGLYSIGLVITLCAAKILATAVTTGFRFGGGMFSPSLFVGAMIGAAFGGLVDQSPLASSSEPFFALIGMGAVAGAVLGAPISTTLIVFELTRSYEASAAMLVSVSIATVIVQSMMRGSIFQRQIERHGYAIAEGPQRIILQTLRVREFMTPVSKLEKEKIMEGAALFEDDSLGRALALLKAEDLDGAAVKRRGGDQPVTGYISRTDALIAYNKALEDAHIERSR